MAQAAGFPQFSNFDNEKVYKECEESLFQMKSRNFIIEFDSTKARCVRDVNDAFVKDLLKTDHSNNPTTRWINIWCPEQQKPLIKALAAQYQFSPRLAGIMCSEHNPDIEPPTPSRSSVGWRGRIPHYRSDRGSAETELSNSDKNDYGIPLGVNEPMSGVNHYKVVNEVWHYSSVDWGSAYTCVGFNTLSDTKTTLKHGYENDEKVKKIPNKPQGKRIWTWLVLCTDGTVISLHENPFPNYRGDQTPEQQRLLFAIRRNWRNVLKQLSTANDAYRRNHPIHTLDIRPGLSSNQQNTIDIKDSPSLLFFYLFDDWYTSYGLVAKDEQQYGQQLEGLRGNMFEKPEVHLINQLHQYGRELAVLKRMYQSYALVIERILDRQTPAGLTSTPPDASHIGAPLSSAATVRFGRLLDRINHLALSEIQECLDEKADLVFLNFNLLTMDESKAIGHLTRITILLAKVTILFMPVSLMTAYFSTQLKDIQNLYTIKTYWISFAVVATLSFLLLLILGLKSDTVEGGPVYRMFSQGVERLPRGILEPRKTRKSREPEKTLE